MKTIALLAIFVITTVGLNADMQTTDTTVVHEKNVMNMDTKFAKDTAVTPADHELNKNIRSEITGWFSNDYNDIVIATNNGVVTITGFVPSQEAFDKLTTEVKEVKGVKEVHNNVQVRTAVDH